MMITYNVIYAILLPGGGSASYCDVTIVIFVRIGAASTRIPGYASESISFKILPLTFERN